MHGIYNPFAPVWNHNRQGEMATYAIDRGSGAQVGINSIDEMNELKTLETPGQTILEVSLRGNFVIIKVVSGGE